MIFTKKKKTLNFQKDLFLKCKTQFQDGHYYLLEETQLVLELFRELELRTIPCFIFLYEKLQKIER